MVGEEIYDEDTVIFHPELTEGNGIYVVSIGNTLVVKRVEFASRTKLSSPSERSRYPPACSPALTRMN